MNLEQCRAKIKELKMQDEIIIAQIRALNSQKIQLQDYKNDPKESLKIQELKAQADNKKDTVKTIRENIKYLVELEALISNLDDMKISTYHMNYPKFSPNDHIYIPNEKITGILLYECKEPLNTWSVLIRKNNKMIIKLVHINQIRPYEHSCWNCGTGLNGMRDFTCPQCHWTKCHKCGKCRRPICIDNNITIEDSSFGFNPPNGFEPPVEFSYTNWSNAQIVDDDSEVVDGF